MKGEYRLAWQKGQKALFAEVVLECRAGALPKYSVEIPNDVSEPWVTGIRFGIEFFLESFSMHEQLAYGIHIHIDRLDGQVVDTTVASVAYVTFHAVGHALGVDTERVFQFDENTGSFMLNVP